MRPPSPRAIQARALRAEGLTMQQIAEKMGCNRGTVSKWLAKDTIKAQSNELDRLISDAQQNTLKARIVRILLEHNLPPFDLLLANESAEPAPMLN